MCEVDGVPTYISMNMLVVRSVLLISGKYIASSDIII